MAPPTASPSCKNGACFAPDTIKVHCSYAVNSFYQRNNRKNQNPQACVFSGTATLSNYDPSQSTAPPTAPSEFCIAVSTILNSLRLAVANLRSSICVTVSLEVMFCEKYSYF